MFIFLFNNITRIFFLFRINYIEKKDDMKLNMLNAYNLHIDLLSTWNKNWGLFFLFLD